MDPFQHLVYKIANAPLRTFPYPHFFVEEAFPEDYYQELIGSFPETEFYQNLSQSGRVTPGKYDKRFILPLAEEELSKLPLPYFFFWQKFQLELNDGYLLSLLLEKFSAALKERFGEELNTLRFWPYAELVRDYEQYSIGPHTDHPIRAITLLFYFPANNEKSHLGTSIYRPKAPHFRCGGTVHHPFDGFVEMQRMPYVRNSIVGFVRTDQSFHGVAPIQDGAYERNLMNYYLRWERVNS